MKKALIIILLISAVMGLNFVCADSESEIRHANIRLDGEESEMENAGDETNREDLNDVKSNLKEEIINKHSSISKQVSGNGRAIGFFIFLSLLGMVGIKYLKRE